LRIYHGGTHNYITGVKGDLVITTDGGCAAGIILDTEDDTLEIKYSGTTGASFGTGGLCIVSGDVYSIAGTEVLSATALASTVKVNNANWSGADLGVANGGTNLSVYAVGDVVYASGTTTLAKLAKGSEDEVLTMGGSCAPTWAAAAGGGACEANACQIKCEATGTLYAPPDLIKHSPGVAKVWCQIASGGAVSSPDYGVSSVSDISAGDAVINYTTAFSSVVYAGGGFSGNDSTDPAIMALAVFATGSVHVTSRKQSDGLRLDVLQTAVLFGYQ
jgi:hypothetical protein